MATSMSVCHFGDQSSERESSVHYHFCGPESRNSRAYKNFMFCSWYMVIGRHECLYWNIVAATIQICSCTVLYV